MPGQGGAGVFKTHVARTGRGGGPGGDAGASLSWLVVAVMMVKGGERNVSG